MPSGTIFKLPREMKYAPLSFAPSKVSKQKGPECHFPKTPLPRVHIHAYLESLKKECESQSWAHVSGSLKVWPRHCHLV